MEIPNILYFLTECNFPCQKWPMPISKAHHSMISFPQIRCIIFLIVLEILRKIKILNMMKCMHFKVYVYFEIMDK